MSPARRARAAASAPPPPPPPFDTTVVEPVREFAPIGIRAFTTTRANGTFRLDGADAAGEVVARWHGLQAALGTSRLASARQVHGDHVLIHGGGWRGWLRYDGADGHVTHIPRTALAVGIADCVPVFLAHPNGTVGVLHAGWRGVAAGILGKGLATMAAFRAPAAEVYVHAGPAICGRCYEVSPDVYEQLTGSRVKAATLVDLRVVLARQAGAAGVRHFSQSVLCTKCDGARLFSHRGGDAGRQVGVIVAGGGTGAEG